MKIEHSIQQLRDITDLHPHDVLCGRGAGLLKWAGNLRFREMCENKRFEYLQLKKSEKTYLAQAIVSDIRSLSPPGRFLQKDGQGQWYEIGTQKALEKTSQALREGAPRIRKNISASVKSIMTKSLELTSASVDAASGNNLNPRAYLILPNQLPSQNQIISSHKPLFPATRIQMLASTCLKTTMQSH
jgi:hypothetical protein